MLEDTAVNATEGDILACQFHKWFETFRTNTMKSVIINLPEDFVAYLLQDGVILPTTESSAFGRDELSDDEDLVETEGDLLDREDFSQLSADIRSAIIQLKGEVFPKFNWSAPSDASWLRGGSLKCTDAADVYLLLKSSDRIVFDIENMFNLCTDSTYKRPDTFTLVLRSWANLDPAMEFRVFVGEGHILGITQRDCASYYDYLAREKEILEDKIVIFWEEKVKGKFLLNKYSMDVFVDRKRRVWIVDLNPFGDPSSALLFEWGELLDLSTAIRENREKNISEKEKGSVEEGQEESEKGEDKKEEELVDVSPSPIKIHIPSPIQIDIPSPIQIDIPSPIQIDDEDPIQETEIDFEFRIIKNQNETFSSTAGSSRGPIDVTLAPDFHKFMEICKNQDKADKEEAQNNDLNSIDN